MATTAPSMWQSWLGGLRNAGRPPGVEIGGERLRLARTPSGQEAAWTLREVNAGRDVLRAAASAVLRRTREAVCAFAMPEVEAFSLRLQAPAHGSLDAAVVEQARRRLGDRLDAMVLDYALLPEHVLRPDEGAVAVLTFVARREPVTAALARVVESGLEPARLLTPGCALAPWIGRDDPDRRYLVLASGDIATSVVVVQAGVVLLERILPWGVASLAEHLNQELGLDLDRARRLLQRSDDASLRRVLGAPIQSFVRQTIGCIGYCDSFYRPTDIAAALVVGPLGGSNLLGPAITDALDLPASSPDEMLAPELLAAGREAIAYAVPVACALWPGEDPP